MYVCVCIQIYTHIYIHIYMKFSEHHLHPLLMSSLLSSIEQLLCLCYPFSKFHIQNLLLFRAPQDKIQSQFSRPLLVDKNLSDDGKESFQLLQIIYMLQCGMYKKLWQLIELWIFDANFMRLCKPKASLANVTTNRVTAICPQVRSNMDYTEQLGHEILYLGSHSESHELFPLAIIF